MRSSRYLLVLCLVIAGTAEAQDPRFELVDAIWTESGSGSASPVSLKSDAAGFVVAGLFHHRVDFDPGPGVVELVSGHGKNTFVARYSAAGDLVWVAGLVGLLVEAADMALGPNGEVVVVGRFSATMTLASRMATPILENPWQSSDGFVVKFQADGQLAWARQHFDSGSYAAAVAVDSRGAIWTAGRPHFSGALRRWDANGNVELEAMPSYRVSALAIGPDDDVYVGGDFSGSQDFDLGPGAWILTSVGYLDAFVLRATRRGRLRWAVSAGGTAQDYLHRLAADRSGGVVAVGYFQGSADFDPDPSGVWSLASIGKDPFVWSLGPKGSLRWAAGLEGGGNDSAADVAILPGIGVAVTGSFSQTMDSDPGPSVVPLTSAHQRDAFIVVLDRAGRYVWSGQIAGFGTDLGLGVARRADEVAIAGYFYDVADLDPTSETLIADPLGLHELFISRVRIVHPSHAAADE